MLGEVLCHTEVTLDGRCTTVRRAECNLGNLITNAMLEATHAEAAILNSGYYTFHSFFVSFISIV